MSESYLSINSIYKATEGEGIHIGRPQVFVRFQGCFVGCVNCDSKDTWLFDDPAHNKWTLSKVLDEIWSLSGEGSLSWVSITGGDPLHPKNVSDVEVLTKELKKKGFFINIEAAGTRVVPSLFDMVDYISFDFKTPSTNVKTDQGLIQKMEQCYKGKFQVKSVVESKIDFEYCQKSYLDLKCQLESLAFPWVLTPSYNVNEPFPEKRFQDVLSWNESSGAHFRVIGQQHKWVFGSSAKNV